MMEKMTSCFILLLSLTACASPQPSSSIMQIREETRNTTIYIDRETGVQYLKVYGGGIIRMENADGTAKIYKYYNEPAQINIDQPISPVQNNITITNN